MIKTYWWSSLVWTLRSACLGEKAAGMDERLFSEMTDGRWAKNDDTNGPSIRSPPRRLTAHFGVLQQEPCGRFMLISFITWNNFKFQIFSWKASLIPNFVLLQINFN